MLEVIIFFQGLIKSLRFPKFLVKLTVQST